MGAAAEYQTPGQLISALLDRRGWTHDVLALVLGYTAKSAISHIIAGRRDVDAELALKLGAIFNEKPETFLDLQKKYDLARARMLQPTTDPALTRRADLYGRLPVAEMIKRGWIAADNVRAANVESELARFFGAASVDEIEILPHAAKKTEVAMPASPAQLAWLYRVRAIASEVLVPRYTPEALRAVLPRLRDLMNDPENVRHVPRILMECGVRFLIVETIANAKVDGVCFWMNEAPVIAMSMRFDRIDNFWFVLRHEIEHALRGHGRDAIMLDGDYDGDAGSPSPAVAEEERVANEAAADFCVPQEKLRKFVTVKAPFYPERDMLGFARTLRIHPGIVAGQIRRATNRFDLYKKHDAKVRSAVTSAATVDGWGDVVPLATT